jgi:glutamyl-tRNA(Gln) amidotransferase subunit E
MKDHDYKKVGLKAGLEIHQQLNTKTKLFCRSPTELRNTKESSFEFSRYLRPSKSEMGEIDRAALEEGSGTRRFVYKGYDTTCLVEYDEEPPLEMNLQAVKIALQIALLFDMKPFDEVNVMRKLVIDGSNTSGFQRTALLASDGFIDLSSGRIRIDTLSVEEEAAQIVGNDIYSLDRLGIPLVEIGTAPDIKTPKMAKELALKIGTTLRACNVKRGLGTIRQDINISIEGGARVEIKGLQTLELIEDIIKYEVERQKNLLKIRDELIKKSANIGEPIEVSTIFTRTNSNVLKGKMVWAVKLSGFKGLIGKEIQPDRRLGSELADRAKKKGVGGIFHTDELPKYGITMGEIERLLAELGCGENDAAAFVASETAKTALQALYAVIERAEEAMIGVPEETRRPLSNGGSEYMRPLPGAARMYPETDVSPIRLSDALVRRIKANLPELLDNKVRRYKREFGLNDELARQIAWSENRELFERIVKLWMVNMDANEETEELKEASTLIVRTLESTMSRLRREEVPVNNLKNEHFIKLFDLVKSKTIAKEGIPEILRSLAQCPTKEVKDIAADMGFEMLSREELEYLVDSIVQSKHDFIQLRGLGAVGPLMGILMKEIRGKADGKVINTLLREKVLESLETG